MPDRIYKIKPISRHMVIHIKIWKTKRRLVIKKKQITNKGTKSYQCPSTQNPRQWHANFQITEWGGNLEPRIFYPSKYYLKVISKYSQSFKASKSLSKKELLWNKSNKIVYTINISGWTSPEAFQKCSINLSDQSMLYLLC